MEDTTTEIKQSLPGFRFHPYDEELLIDYLKPKILDSLDGCLDDEQFHGFIPEVDVCQYDPWHLPTLFNESSPCKSKNGRELIFFCRVKRKYLNSHRSDRTTDTGYWKVTGKERSIWSDKTDELIGTKKTLVFYQGRVPKGKRTDWVMHEYHLNPKCLGDNGIKDQMPYVACRVKNKKGKKGNHNKKGDAAANQEDDANSSSPLTSTSVSHQGQVIDPGDYSSFCNTPNIASENDQADECARLQPEVSVGELLESLPQCPPLDHNFPNCNGASTYYGSYAGAEGLFSFDNWYGGGNYVFGQGNMQPPYADDESYLDYIDWTKV